MVGECLGQHECRNYSYRTKLIPSGVPEVDSRFYLSSSGLTGGLINTSFRTIATEKAAGLFHFLYHCQMVRQNFLTSVSFTAAECQLFRGSGLRYKARSWPH